VLPGADSLPRRRKRVVPGACAVQRPVSMAGGRLPEIPKRHRAEGTLVSTPPLPKLSVA
jgi:hypothetical protein